MSSLPQGDACTHRNSWVHLGDLIQCPPITKPLAEPLIARLFSAHAMHAARCYLCKFAQDFMFIIKDYCPTWAKSYPAVGSVCFLTGIE